LTVTFGSLSVTVGVPVLTTASQEPAEVFAVTFAGQAMTGVSSSVTVTLKLQEAGEPMPFVAVHCTAVVPTGNVCGEVMEVAPTLQSTVGAGLPPAVAAKVTEAENWPGSVPTLMSAGQEMVAGEPTGVTVGSPNAPVAGSSVCTEPPV
jgi:hypothetical protein